MFIGYLLFGFGLKFTDVSKVTIITLIEPVVATNICSKLYRQRANHNCMDRHVIYFKRLINSSIGVTKKH